MVELRKRRVKLQDIATESGVSLTAVSLALSGKPGISQETRARVLEIARSMGYRFKPAGSTSGVKAIKTIGLLVKTGPEEQPHANYFYSPVISGIEATCRSLGINLMFGSVPVDPENHPLELPPLIEKGEVDGLLLAGVFVDDHLGELLGHLSFPVILVDSYSTRPVFDAVLSDNFRGAYHATEYLIQKGHRVIGFICGSEHAYPSFVERRQGCRQAAQDHQLEPVTFADSSTNREEVVAAAVSLYRQRPEITAVVGVNDEVAISAMYALIEMGKLVPRDISIIGYDDIHLAESVVPSLTTMHVNKAGMGRLAVQLLLNHSSHSDGGNVTSVFQPLLVERSSTASLLQDE